MLDWPFLWSLLWPFLWPFLWPLLHIISFPCNHQRHESLMEIMKRHEEDDSSTWRCFSIREVFAGNLFDKRNSLVFPVFRLFMHSFLFHCILFHAWEMYLDYYRRWECTSVAKTETHFSHLFRVSRQPYFGSHFGSHFVLLESKTNCKLTPPDPRVLRGFSNTLPCIQCREI